MGYVTAAQVRSMFNFSATDVSDAQLTEFIGFAESEIYVRTGRTWSGIEKEYGAVQRADIYLVAADVYERLRGDNDRSKSLRNEAQGFLANAIRSYLDRTRDKWVVVDKLED